MQAERRKHPRRGVYFRVDYVDSKGQAAMGLAKNLSLGGMFLEEVSNLSLGDIITASFAIPTGQPFKVTAQVAHVSPTGCGLRFEDLQDRYETESIQNLEQYCAA